jgi:hypothetical protein
MKSKDFVKIKGKTPFTFKEIRVFPNLKGISPLIVQTQ